MGKPTPVSIRARHLNAERRRCGRTGARARSSFNPRPAPKCRATGADKLYNVAMVFQSAPGT